MTHHSGLGGRNEALEGVYHCTAVVDMVAGERRLTWQEGYMPWVAKGPPSIEEYIAASQ